jgi:hypothetical protein
MRCDRGRAAGSDELLLLVLGMYRTVAACMHICPVAQMSRRTGRPDRRALDRDRPLLSQGRPPRQAAERLQDQDLKRVGGRKE